MWCGVVFVVTVVRFVISQIVAGFEVPCVIAVWFDCCLRCLVV